jgi:hypothetical protein
VELADGGLSKNQLLMTLIPQSSDLSKQQIENREFSLGFVAIHQSPSRGEIVKTSMNYTLR